MNGTVLLETLVMLVEGMSDHGESRAWISRLSVLNEADRKIELRRLAEQMKAAGDANVAGAVALLAKPEIFAEVCRVLEERAR